MDLISSSNIKEIIAPHVHIALYRAKAMGASEWVGEDLKARTLLARESYIPRYGDVGKVDRFDESATIYLVRTSYKDANGTAIDEWLSARFVLPHLHLLMHETHELLQSLYSGQPTLAMLRGFCPYAVKNIAIVSRICGYRTQEGVSEGVGDIQNLFLPLTHTAFAFTLMVDQFLLDYNSGGDIRVILGLFRNELIRKALTITALGQVPRFYFGQLLFPLSTRKEFRIDRNSSAYDFPSYFLNTEKLGKTLAELIASQLLTKECVANHFTNPTRIEQLLNGKTIPYHEYRMMGKLLSHQGLLPGSTMHGDDLRMILDAKVPDGPELRVLKTDQFSAHAAWITEHLQNTP